MTVLWFKFSGPYSPGLGDQLMGLASWLAIAHNLNLILYVDLPFLQNNSVVSLNKDYDINNYINMLKEKDHKEIKILHLDCLDNQFVLYNKIFWEKLNDYDIIQIKENAPILIYFVNNNITPFSLSSLEQVMQELQNSLRFFFDHYITFNKEFIQDLLPYIKSPLLTIHFRSNDDIYMVKHLTKQDWPHELLEDVIKFLKCVKAHMDINKIEGYKIILLSDLHRESMMDIANDIFGSDIITTTKSVPKHLNYSYNNTTDNYDLFFDFMLLAHSDKVYITSNSNFSRNALLLGKWINKNYQNVNPYFYSYHKNEFMPFSVNVLIKKGSNAYNEY